MKTQVTFVKTVVGWYNIYSDGEVINIDPATFKAYFPSVSPKASIGCFEIDSDLFKVDNTDEDVSAYLNIKMA